VLVLVLALVCNVLEYEYRLTPEYEYENAEILDL
jgi:hypothetical protein